MTYLELCLFVEMFTVRYSKQYERGLVVRCRIFILNTFKKVMFLCPNSTHISPVYFRGYLYDCALPLDSDDFLFITKFIRYFRDLTN